MKQLKYSTKIGILLLMLTCCINTVIAQENSSYEMTLLKVIDHEEEKSISVILKVSPRIENFKLIVSGKAEYAFGRKSILTNIQTDPNIRIVIYGENFYIKAPELFDPIKEEIEMKENEFLIVFAFSNVMGKELVQGFFKYGLWESNNSNIRNEQTFYFTEDKIIKN